MTTTTTTLAPTGTHAVGGRVRSVTGAVVPSMHATSVCPMTTADLPPTTWPPGSHT